MKLLRALRLHSVARHPFVSPGWHINAIGLSLLSTYIGLCYVLSDPVRVSAPAYVAAADIRPIPVWGWVYILLGLWTAFTYVTGRGVVSSYLATGSMAAFWGTLFMVSALTTGTTPLTGLGIYLFIAVSSFAIAFSAAWARDA